MSEHPIQGMMDTTMEKIRKMVDVNTIIGRSDYLSGRHGNHTGFKGRLRLCCRRIDWPSKQPKELFGGGSGAGISIQPIAFLVIANGEVRLLKMDADASTADRIVEAVRA